MFIFFLISSSNFYFGIYIFLHIKFLIVIVITTFNNEHWILDPPNIGRTFKQLITRIMLKQIILSGLVLEEK